MDFKDTILQLADRIARQKDSITTEAVVKNSIIICFGVFVLIGCSNSTKTEEVSADTIIIESKTFNNSDSSKNTTEDRLMDGIMKRRLSSMSGEEFCQSITDPDIGVYKATITDANILIIAVNPIGTPNFDVFAQSYLESAIEKGVDVKGCFVVDVNNAKFQQGAVIGDRIGKAYK